MKLIKITFCFLILISFSIFISGKFLNSTRTDSVSNRANSSTGRKVNLASNKNVTGNIKHKKSSNITTNTHKTSNVKKVNNKTSSHKHHNHTKINKNKVKNNKKGARKSDIVESREVKSSESRTYSSDSLEYLVGLNLGCNPNQVLQGFQLVYDKTKNSIEYKFDCLAYHTVGANRKTKTTEYVAFGGSPLEIYNRLQTIPMNCDANLVMQGFSLIKNSDSQVAYKYACVEIIHESCSNLLLFNSPSINTTDPLSFIQTSNVNLTRRGSIVGLNLQIQQDALSWNVTYCDITDPEEVAAYEAELAKKEAEEAAAREKEAQLLLEKKKQQLLELERALNQSKIDEELAKKKLQTSAAQKAKANSTLQMKKQKLEQVQQTKALNLAASSYANKLNSLSTVLFALLFSIVLI